MSQIDWDTPETEARLLAEIADLRRQLEEQKRLMEYREDHQPEARPARPSHRALFLLAAVALLLIVVGFLAGYVPYQRRESLLTAEAKAQEESVPSVTVMPVQAGAADSELVLPGNIQAFTEAPILARADGYVKKRFVDIGDRVKSGQVVAEIEAPELDQQVRQAKAALEQTQSAQEQAVANLRQGKTNEELARVTAQRWSNLAKKGVVSRQENDQYQAQYQAQLANSQALEKAIGVARSNVSAAEANLARLTELKSYKQVRAPFSGVITVRNVDLGALITAGSTLLFREAQTGVVRAYVNVPQSDAGSVHVGQAAQVVVSEIPGRTFSGTITRTSDSLDMASRTLLTEVQVPNPDGLLKPGTYVQVDLNNRRKTPPLLIPGDALVVRTEGPQVAVVGPDGRVHFQKIALGRDYGDRIEILSGLSAGQNVVINPGDTVRDGARVNPVPPPEKTQPKAVGGSH